MYILGSRVTGPYWPESIRIAAQEEMRAGTIAFSGAGEATGYHYGSILPAEAWQQANVVQWRPSLDADASHYRLALEGERLRLGYSCDPLLATNNAAIHLLPHQLEAVYTFMLPQPVIRHLMAHDAGAGKTVMCGLLHKELRMRQPALRTLIVAPAALVLQWQREMRDKFFESFGVVDRDSLRKDPEIWTKTQQAITSVSFASQYEIRATLAAVPWDLVVIDEAHHMAGYETRHTQAYELGRILARRTKHLVLATATPHKGDAVNFLKLLQLLDAGVTDPSVACPADGSMPGTPMMLRRLKEEMVGFDGQPLFRPREVETRWYLLSDNSSEWGLYRALTDYVTKTYRAAEKLGGQVRVNTQFAMTILQRRVASSLAALEHPLLRRRHALLSPSGSAPQAPLSYGEDAPEAERWAAEARAETVSPARSARERHREVDEIDQLLVGIEGVHQQGPETKVVKLQEVMVEAGVVPGNGERLLVFTEFLDTLVFLRRLFEEWGYTVTQIDGSMSQQDRLQAEKEFHERCQVMVATEAAGEGINLQFCARMVNFDLPWVPARLEQRMRRIHRYGQERVARIYNLGAGDTREGFVLRGLMERLEVMRDHLGDRVFDVISLLVADADVEALLAKVAASPAEQGSQYEVLQELLRATERGVERYRQGEGRSRPLDPRAYDDIRQASRHFRLTPEYAQHFVVDVLQTLGEAPEAWPSQGSDPGDAQGFAVTAQRKVTAECLGVRQGEQVVLTFDQEMAGKTTGARLLALGSPTLDRFLALAKELWGSALPQGALFWDASLPAGKGYLIWHIKGRVLDGQGQIVSERLFAVRQNQDSLENVPTSALIDLAPATSRAQLPAWMTAFSHDPAAAWAWSLEHQQMPWLRHESARRRGMVTLRRASLVSEATRAVALADQAYQEAVWEMQLDADVAERGLHEAQCRLSALQEQLAREEACSLTFAEILGVSAVLPLAEPPVVELRDLRPEVAEAAMAAVVRYEQAHGREVTDLTGDHYLHPYDLHSTGPGGPRCIEVKGTTTGRIFMSENERRAAQRLRGSFYLYIVTDPLGQAPVTVVRDPLTRMAPDVVLHTGAHYGFDAATWRAAADEGTP
ncbi:MAG TPA: helicase-related protein [Anaerolineae bacterium]|nr:helicase-related protein [Anaerolineae bacterium]